jgi:hydroxymethylpyrimidine pyrophosphatase-like HAD family hydrolase
MYIEEMQMDCSWNIYSMNSWIVKNEDDERVRREECIVEAKAKCGSVKDIPNGTGVSKILCMCNPSKTVEIEEALKAKFPCLSIMRSSDILIEIMNKGITKSGAVSFLCDRWQIPLEETVAFGDNYNDYDMLKTVGEAFLMGNAPKELQAEFKNVVRGNDEGGIYQGLKQLHIVK